VTPRPAATGLAHPVERGEDRIRTATEPESDEPGRQRRDSLHDRGQVLGERDAGDQRHSYHNPGAQPAIGYSVVVLARVR